MKLDKVHIVSFDNPYPPNYGGVIDVYYKIKFLHKLKIDVYLHIFTHDKFDITHLQTYCKAIYSYKRNKSYFKFLSQTPFRVTSRVSAQIYDNLIQIKAPILFEGLQSTAILQNHTFDSKVLLRAHNIEHLYYYGLSKSTPSIFKKIVFLLEGMKFEKYETLLNKFDAILAISKTEEKYFNSKYKIDVHYIPVFHGNENVLKLNGRGDYALYHGDLTTEDNIQSVKFLIDVFAKLPHPLYIASSNLPKSLETLISHHEHIHFKTLGEQPNDLQDLIANAHVNVLYSKQATGTKLKVFYALYNGRFCIVNNNIVDDDAILSLCEVANTKEELSEKIRSVFLQEYHLTQERENTLQDYLPSNHAEKLVTILTDIINTNPHEPS